jgi:sortase A
MTAWRIVGGIGRALVGFGVLVLLFAAYLLWGTNIAEASHQHDLRSRFDQVLAHAHGATTSTTAPGSSETTVPQSLVSELVAGDAPAEGQPVAVIDIPKIGVQKVVVEGTNHDDLQQGPGHYTGTPLPGQPGNAAIAGHRTTYGAPFYNLNELTPGAHIDVTTLQGHFTYAVVKSFTVAPTDGSVLGPSDSPMLTLTTCNPRFSAAQRLIVQADLTTPTAPAPTPSAAPKPVSVTKVADNLGGGQGAWGGAAAWGGGTVALAVGTWLVARRGKSWRRWIPYGVGVLPMLVLLYFFFENVSPLLPASF